MATFAAISNLAPSDAHPFARPAADTPSGTSTITANDFLALLVTEMKNQDPTNATDPNQYVNQLVSVNSLEQLIEINQTLAGALTPSEDVAASSAHPSTSRTAPAGDAPLSVSGNLAVPSAQPAALQIARALAPQN